MLENLIINNKENQYLSINAMDNKIMHKVVIEVYNGSGRIKVLKKKFEKGALYRGYSQNLYVEGATFFKIITSIPDDFLSVEQANSFTGYESQYSDLNISGLKIFTFGNLVTAKKKIITYGLSSQLVNELRKSFEEFCIIAITLPSNANLEKLEISVKSFVRTSFKKTNEEDFLEITSDPKFKLFENSKKLVYCLTENSLDELCQEAYSNATLILDSKNYSKTSDLRNRIFYYHGLSQKNMISYSLPLIFWILCNNKVIEKIFRYENFNLVSNSLDFRIFTNAAIVKNKKIREVAAFMTLSEDQQSNKYLYVYKKADENSNFKYLVPTKEMSSYLFLNQPYNNYFVTVLILSGETAIEGYVYNGEKKLVIDGGKYEDKNK